VSRLKSTKSIFRAKIQTTAFLLRKTDKQIEEDLRALDALHKRLLRTKREETLKRFHERLSVVAASLDYPVPSSYDREAMLRKLNIYKKHHRFLRYTAIEHACVHLCTVYEDLIRRVVLKYYEEDIRRLKSRKESIKNSYLVDIVLAGHNIHRNLAERVVDDLMYGSIEDWHRTLKDMGMEIMPSQGAKELFLVRNCMIHNDKRVSPQLNQMLPEKYRLRRNIHLTISDFNDYMSSVEKSATFIMSEYNRLFPINTGTWVGVSYD
jgi:hypothetical protein